VTGGDVRGHVHRIRRRQPRFMQFLGVARPPATSGPSRAVTSRPTKNVSAEVVPRPDDPEDRRSARPARPTLRFDMSDQPAVGVRAPPMDKGEWKLFQDFLSNTSNVDGIITQELESAAAQAYGS